MVYAVNGRKRKNYQKMYENSEECYCNGYEVISKLTTLVEKIGTSNYIPQINYFLKEDDKIPSKRKRNEDLKYYNNDILKLNCTVNTPSILISSTKENLPPKNILYNYISPDLILRQYSVVRLWLWLVESSNKM